MKWLSKYRYFLEGYAAGFSIFPRVDPKEDMRRVWQDIGDAMRDAMGVLNKEIKEDKHVRKTGK